MTTRHDDDPAEPSDPVLASMRTVWLSMRDEEPPSGGLTELLAAARAKAEALQPKPPWWQRALRALQRPPALALATAVVLIGGAVLVGGRRDKLEPAFRAPAAPQVAQSAASGEPGQPARELAPNDVHQGDRGDTAGSVPVAEAEGYAAPKGPAAAPSDRDRDAARSAATQDGRAAGGTTVTPAPPRAAEPPRPVRPRPEANAPVRADDRGVANARVTAPDAPKTEAPKTDAPPSVPPPPPPAAPPQVSSDKLSVREEPRNQQGAGQRELEIADEAIQVTGAASSSDAAKTDRYKGKASDVEAIRPSAGDDDPAPGRNRPARSATLEQLAKQSIVAASRSDCAAVRAIVSRMQKMDKAQARTHVAANAAVRQCLK